jgi:enoyl-CoA hydratase/carnithine racemase
VWETICFERDGGVAIISMNYPKALNAFNVVEGDRRAR